MPTPSFRRASFREILLAVREQLVEVTGLDDTRVFVSVLSPEDAPRYAAFQDILLRPMGEEPDVGNIDGAGRYDNRRTRQFEVAVRTRVALDQSDRDHARLTDESLGHIVLEDLVVEALELFHLEDDDSDVLAAPLRVGRLSMPQRLRSDAHWVFSAFVCEAEYRRDLTVDISIGKI